MSYDFNDTESNTGDLIPKGTVAPVVMIIRPGKSGDGGWLTQSKSSDYQYLDCEFTVSDGPFRNRKFWSLLMVEHPSPQEEKVAKTLGISRSKLRGILESARKVDPKDESEAATAKRIVTGYGDFSGMEFVAKVGFEKGQGDYADKNVLDVAVPITSKAYATAGSGANDAPAAEKQAAVSGDKPSWA